MIRRISVEDIQIPKRYRSGLEKIATVDEEFFKKLLNSLSEFSPTPRIKDIITLVTRDCEIDIPEARSLVTTIRLLRSVLSDSGVSAEALAQKVSKALEDDSETLTLSGEEVFRFEERLSLLLKIRGSLETSLRASKLLTEYANIFLESRILTDIRPVFKDDIGDGIGGALLIHNLRIAYRTADEFKEIFVALDSTDLEQLLEQIDRAIQKEEFLESLLTEASVPYLDVHQSGDNDNFNVQSLED
jgi:hypothetical protein